MTSGVLVVEDEVILARKIKKYLEIRGCEVETVQDGKAGLKVFESFRPDIVLLDFNLPGGMNGLEFMAEIRAIDPAVKIVMITGHGNVQLAVDAMKAGAFDYLSKPIVLSELRLLIENAVNQERVDAQLSHFRAGQSKDAQVDRILGQSEPIRQLRQRIQQVINAETAQIDGPPPAVLITGETGTGKELAARALHFDGPRRSKPFVLINAATLPHDLLESELFGHERGAFTGARERKIGLAEAASGGTLFLDEIGDLDLSIQAKLLRLVEDRRVRRLGGIRDRVVDIRLLTATNRNLEIMVSNGEFRPDLYYRLRLVAIQTPNLRERREDIPLLAENFLEEFCKRYGKIGLKLSSDAIRAMSQYDWPGNIRELRNVLEQAVLIATRDTIESNQLAISVAGSRISIPAGLQEISSRPSMAQPRLEDIEREVIVNTLEQVGGNVTRAARMLGITRDKLRYRIEKYGLGRAS